MKNIFFLSLFFLSSISFSINAQSCDNGGCNILNINYPTGTFNASTPSVWYQVSATLNSGNYAYYNVTQGNIYQWTTCSDFGGSQGWDGQLTLFNSSNSILCYQDDCSRSNCSNSPYLSWTATFTGTVKVLITEYNCKLNTNQNSAPFAKLVWRTQAPICTPTPPSSVSASIGTPANGIEHHLDVSCPTVSGVDGYSFEFSDNNSTWFPYGSTSTSNYRDFNGGDRPNIPYYFRVRTNCGGTYSNYTYISNPIYTACDAPSAPVITAITSNSANITLVAETPVPNPSTTRYSIKCLTTNQYLDTYGVLGNGFYLSNLATWNNLKITGLSKNTTYTFVAIANNSNGIDSQFNPTITFTTSNNCVTWTNGTPSSTLLTASEYLCDHGIIASTQDYNAINNLTLSQASLTTFKGIYNGRSPNELGLSSLDFPSLITDLDLITNSTEYYATKALSFLEYQDGRPCISRDFSMIRAYDNVGWGRMLRIILEAFNIAPDRTGYDVYSHTASTFLPNILKDNADYSYFNKAYQLGYLSDFILPNGNFDFRNRREFLYIMLYKAIQQYGFPSPNETNYYSPNNFSPTNSGSERGISKAVFETWEQSGLSLASGGLGLNFEFSYHSDLLDYPLASEDRSELAINSSNNYSSYGNLENQSAITKNNPLGIGWTHSYNIYANILISQSGTSGPLEKYLMLHWGDGSINFYNILEAKFITKGVYDDLIPEVTNSDGTYVKFRVVTKNQITYKFERNNNQFFCTKIIDRNGNNVTLNYESAYCNNAPATCNGATNTRLKNVTDSFGSRALNLTYYTDSDLLRNVSDGTRTVYFNLDKYVLNLNALTDAKGQTTQYNYCEYDTCRHILSQITRPKGNIITNTYSKRKLKQTTNGNYLVKINFASSYSSTATSNSTQSTVSVTPASGQTFNTNYTHDANGNVTATSSQTNNIAVTYGDALNPTLPTSIVDNMTNITESFTYDNTNPKGNISRHDKTSGASVITDLFTYNIFNDPLTHTNGNGGVTMFTYNATGNLTDVKNPLDGIAHSDILSSGLINFTLNPSGFKTSFGYNTYGNLTSIQKDINATTHITALAGYDILSRITSITNPRGIQTNYEYDANDNTTKVTEDPTGLNLITNHYFDANDNPIEIKNAKGNSTFLAYDFNTDDLISETFGTFAKQWTYNTDGSTKTFTSKNRVVFNYQYFGAGDSREGMLQSEGNPTDGYLQYDYYTDIKQLKTITRGSKIITYSYDDPFKRTSKINYTDGTINHNVEYRYDNNNNITQIIYPDGKIIYYEYDLNDRLIRIKDWLSRVLVTYNYAIDGRLLSATNGNATSTISHYDVVARLDSLQNNKANGSLLSYFGLKLAIDGNISEVRRNEPDNNLFPNFSNTTTTYNNNAINQETQVNTTALNYDSNGNQTQYGTTPYTFDSRDRLTSTTNFSFDYDPLQNRIKKNNTRYVIDILNGSNVLVETNVSGNPQALYVHGLGLVCRYDYTTNTFSYYHFDERGSTTAITDANGNITHKYIYGPSGESLQKTETFKQPFQYIGKHGVMYDSTNLYFMRERYYNPLTGRFISIDPVWSTNLYPYADNDPINKIDPDGREPNPFTYDGTSQGLFKSFKSKNYLEASVWAFAFAGQISIKALEIISGGTASKILSTVNTFGENYVSTNGNIETSLVNTGIDFVSGKIIDGILGKTGIDNAINKTTYKGVNIIAKSAKSSLPSLIKQPYIKASTRNVLSKNVVNVVHYYVDEKRQNVQKKGSY